MSYPFLQQGDALPTVAVLQTLLNARGIPVFVDGNYGRQTIEAVREYSSRVRHSRASRGFSDRFIWTSLGSGFNLQVIDYVDITDPGLLEDDVRYIEAVGGDPITIPRSDRVRIGTPRRLVGFPSNVLEFVINEIASHSGSGRLCLLRLIGHGHPGMQAIGSGLGYTTVRCLPTGDCDAPAAILDWDLLQISLYSLEEYRSTWERLRDLFSVYGSIELHGCNVGRGAEGERFLDVFAEIIGVPVTAGRFSQWGGAVDTFRFEGPTYTAFPNLGNLQSWADSLPDFIPVRRRMSVE